MIHSKSNALEAPLPADNDFEALKKELDFIQRELLAWNAKLKEPQKEENLKIRTWNEFDDGIFLLLESREKLIKKRQLWVEQRFKNWKDRNRNRLSTPWDI